MNKLITITGIVGIWGSIFGIFGVLITQKPIFLLIWIIPFGLFFTLIMIDINRD